MTLQEAHAALDALAVAAQADTVPAIRYELKARAHEFRRAITALAEANTEGTEACIVTFGEVCRGQYVWEPVSDTEDPWLFVVRQMRTYGQLSIHLERPNDSRGVYLNCYAESSPVVVKA